MFRPDIFREDSPDVLRALIARHPLASLVTTGGGVDANLVPFTLVEGRDGGLLLRAHLAKNNSQVAALRSGAGALVIFRGPEAYVSPSWYATKAEHGRVVPTWNYVLVQAWGRPRVVEAADWILAQIGDLTERQESGRAEPWSVADAPEAFTTKLVSALVGVEIPVDRIEGTWKVSQNHVEANRRGVVEGLRGEPDGAAMAALVAERGGIV